MAQIPYEQYQRVLEAQTVKPKKKPNDRAFVGSLMQSWTGSLSMPHDDNNADAYPGLYIRL